MFSGRVIRKILRRADEAFVQDKDTTRWSETKKPYRQDENADMQTNNPTERERDEERSERPRGLL